MFKRRSFIKSRATVKTTMEKVLFIKKKKKGGVGISFKKMSGTYIGISWEMF